MSLILSTDRAKLHLGDSLALLRSMPDDTADTVLTDPPYSTGGLTLSARQAKPAKKYQNSKVTRSYPDLIGDNRDQRSFTLWATLWLTECWRIAHTGARLMVFSDWRQLPAMTDAIQAAGWLWRGVVVWHKSSARPCLGDFKRDAEFVICGGKGKPGAYSRQCFNGVLHHNVNAARKLHLTEKPVPLLMELLGPTKPGGLVLDPFAGSGSTGEACLRTGRSFVGMEISPDYAEIARKRLEAA